MKYHSINKIKFWITSDDGKYLLELIYDHLPEAMLALFNDEGICLDEDEHHSETERFCVEFDFE